MHIRAANISFICVSYFILFSFGDTEENGNGLLYFCEKEGNYLLCKNLNGCSSQIINLLPIAILMLFLQNLP